MARYRFLIADVFSATPFGGNQLAVLPDARGISAEGMQVITREFNFAESTFVLPADDPAAIRRVRIFTPSRELPFAGHPSVGTACALVKEGIAGIGDFVIEEGIGPVSVSVRQGDSGLEATFTVNQAPTLHADTACAAEAAAAISLDEGDIIRLFAAGLGVDFTFIQLKDRAAVDRAALDHSAWARHFSDKGAGQLYLFAGDLADGGQIYSRMFGPSFGIAEDPATGSAAGILAGAGAGLAGAQADSFTIAITQGVAMGRPAQISASARLQAGKVGAIQVGGATTFVAEGEIDVPERFLTS